MDETSSTYQLVVIKTTTKSGKSTYETEMIPIRDDTLSFLTNKTTTTEVRKALQDKLEKGGQST